MSTAKIVLFCIFFTPPVFGGDILPSEIAFLNKLNDANLSMPEVWEGYRINDPLLVYFEGSDISVLMNATDIPERFKPLKSADINTSRVFYKPGQTASSKAHFSWSIKIDKGHAVSWRMRRDADIEEEVYTFFHEYFHRFQPGRFVKQPEVPLPPKDISDQTVSNYYLEDILLIRALLTTGTERIENIKDFTCLRSSRYKDEKTGVLAYERFKERTEGSAEYVGLRALLPHGTTTADIHEVMTPLLMRRQSFKLSSYAGANSESRFYFSGPAQMILLDAIRTNWKHRLEQGESIFEILRDYFPPENCFARIRDLKKGYNFSGLLSTAKSEADTLRAYEAVKSKSALDLKAYKRVIIKNIPFWTIKPPQSYSNPVKLDDDNTLYDSAELSISDDKKDIKLTINNLPLIYRVRAQSNTAKDQSSESAYEILVKSLSDIEIIADGRRAPKSGDFTLPFKTISLSGLRIDLTAATPGKITKHPDSVTIEFY